MDTSFKIVKPATLLKEDFLNNLVNLCNSSGLPFFVVEYILKDFLLEIHNVSQRQLESDKVKYDDEIKKGQSKKDSD